MYPSGSTCKFSKQSNIRTFVVQSKHRRAHAFAGRFSLCLRIRHFCGARRCSEAPRQAWLRRPPASPPQQWEAGRSHTETAPARSPSTSFVACTTSRRNCNPKALVSAGRSRDCAGDPIRAGLTCVLWRPAIRHGFARGSNNPLVVRGCPVIVRKWAAWVLIAQFPPHWRRASLTTRTFAPFTQKCHNAAQAHYSPAGFAMNGSRRRFLPDIQ